MIKKIIKHIGIILSMCIIFATMCSIDNFSSYPRTVICMLCFSVLAGIYIYNNGKTIDEAIEWMEKQINKFNK